MNPSELNYQVVSTIEHNYKGNNMEQGTKSRQFLAGVIGKLKKKHFNAGKRFKKKFNGKRFNRNLNFANVQLT